MTAERPGRPVDPVSGEPATVLGAAEAVRAGAVSPVSLVEQALEAAARTAPLNAVAHLDADRARADAEMLADEARRGAFRGPLHGVPVTVKDLFAVRGLPMAAGTRAPLPDALPSGGRPARADAEAVARLRAAGAVVVATTNLVEIALGITGENAWTGDVCHPRDPARQAGGSSSGSAVAVATGVGLASLGTDTAGSVRIPAALCGLVGAKPTHGRVPLDGALALSPTCDHGGPLTRSVADAALVLDVLAGEDATPVTPVRPARVGVLGAHLDGALHPEVRRRFADLLDAVREAGADLVTLAPDHLDDTLGAYTPLVRAEAAHVHRRALASAPDGFSDVVRRPLEAGLTLPAVDYLEARAARRRVADGLARVLATVDVLVVPTNPVPAPRRGAAEVELESGRAPHRDAFLRLTAPYSLVGVPAVTLPYAEVDGLPLGVSVVAPAGGDRAGLAAAAWLEDLVGRAAA